MPAKHHVLASGSLSSRDMLLMAGRNSQDLNKAAEGQALSLLSFAWGYVFEAPTGTLHFMDIRCHRLIEHLHSSVHFSSASALIRSIDANAWL